MTYQTVSLNVAYHLNEVGWKKHCFLYIQEGSPDIERSSIYESIRDCDLYMPQIHEILEELPEIILYEDIKIPMDEYDLFMSKEEEVFIFGYEYVAGSMMYDKNPHDAAALLWIWCVENGYILLSQE